MAKRVVQMPLVCHGHTRPIVDLAFSAATPDGLFLTSASKDGQPMLRNGATGDWVGTFQGHKGAVWTCTLNDSAYVAATASADFSARVWNACTGEEAHAFPHRHIVRVAAFERGAAATRLVTGGAEKLLRVYDLARPEAEPAALPAAPDALRHVAWAANNSQLLVSYLDRAGVDVWDVRSGGVVRTLESKGAVTSIELGDDGFLTTADGAAVEVRDAATLGVVKRLEVEGYAVESASYCAARRRIVAGGSDMWVRLYDSESGAELEANRGHHGPVHCVRFAPGGATYASGSEDGTIRLWQTDYAANYAAAAAAAAAAENGGGAVPAAPP
jgi:serine-threonine kinase receptor-associated protein